MLEGKVALITGGGQGVGLGIGLALADQGANVALAGRTLEKCEAAANTLRQRGTQALALRCDVKSKEDLQNAIDKTIADFGRLDILVNNAQEVARGPLLEISDTQFSGNFESGPLATFRLMKMAYPRGGK